MSAEPSPALSVQPIDMAATCLQSPATPIDSPGPHAEPTFDRLRISHHPINPNGPHQITCLHSDAIASRWPPIGPIRAMKGVSEWALTEQNSKTRLKWLSTLGKGMAEILNLFKRMSHHPGVQSTIAPLIPRLQLISPTLPYSKPF